MIRQMNPALSAQIGLFVEDISAVWLLIDVAVIHRSFPGNKAFDSVFRVRDTWT